MEQSTVSFEPEGLGKTTFQGRYARTPDETWNKACERVANHVAAAEPDDRVARWRDNFNEVLVEGQFMPGGRIWYGAGRPQAQLLNCFVVPAVDSREGWGKTLSDTIVVSGTGGGVGINSSPVRPRGAEIKGTGGHATGSVSLMQMIDRVGDVLRGGGGRRLALMLALNINHPDVNEFINVKLNREELTNANVSIVLPTGYGADDLIRDVKEGNEIAPMHRGVPTGGLGIDAAELWETIVDNAWTSGEPGVLNGALANEQSNIFYHKPLVCTNPCGEIWLEEYGSCCLGALVLSRFVNESGDTDWDALDRVVRIAVRFLDNVLTVNDYPLTEISENSREVRRLGLGVMGLHTYLLKKGLKYSSKSGRNEVDNLFQFIKNTAYDESTTLAAEKGAFPAYSPQLLDSGFAKTLKRGIRSKIRTHGLRNAALLTVAPTGTTGMVHGVTTGIEPVMSARYLRRYNTEEGQDSAVVEDWHSIAYPDHIEDASNMHPEEHFKMQEVVQMHVDNAVSKTINLPKAFPKEELSDLWLKYLPSIKGSTFYRWGSRENEPIQPLAPAAEVEEVEADPLVPFDPSCPDGSCEL